ncbi:MAG: hypothetical protein EB051_00095 [Chlamydiia bacterium]|jgi:hypothetical protein|nr:hypothetical protein [Chlamydiia bacterium]
MFCKETNNLDTTFKVVKNERQGVKVFLRRKVSKSGAFEELKKSLEMTISLEKSEKHMSHRDFKGIFSSAA